MPFVYLFQFFFLPRDYLICSAIIKILKKLAGLKIALGFNKNDVVLLLTGEEKAPFLVHPKQMYGPCNYVGALDSPVITA